MLYGNPNLTGRERTFRSDEIIVTKTDLSGKIVYGNNTFYKLAGYDEKDVLGQQHNIIRHPDMPRGVFKLLWDTLQKGDEIFAYVNNRSLNGDHYWVLAHVTPSFNSNGDIISYHSNRRAPDRNLIDEKIIPLYRDLLALEKAEASPKEGMNKSVEAVVSLLKQNDMNFNQFMFSLGM